MWDLLRTLKQSIAPNTNLVPGNWGMTPAPAPTKSVDQNFLSTYNISPLTPQTNNGIYPTVNVNQQGQVLGDNRGFENTTNTGPNIPKDTTPQDTGKQEQETWITKWLADLENAKREGSALRESGQRGFDTLLAGIGDFRNRVGQQFTDAGQQITNQFGGITGQNARLGQSARTKAIQQARVGNYGDSSRLGMLNQVTGNLAGMQGQAIARRGENDAENRRIRQGREDEANNQERMGRDRFRDITEEAGRIERMGVQNAGYNLAGGLSNMISNQRALANMQPLNGQGLTQYSPNFNGLTNSLNTVLGGLNSGLSQESQGMASNLAQSPNFQDILRKQYGYYNNT